MAHHVNTLPTYVGNPPRDPDSADKKGNGTFPMFTMRLHEGFWECVAVNAKQTAKGIAILETKILDRAEVAQWSPRGAKELCLDAFDKHAWTWAKHGQSPFDPKEDK